MNGAVWLLESWFDLNLELCMPFGTVQILTRRLPDVYDFDNWDEVAALRFATDDNHYCFILGEPD